jgi:NAD(P)-dependent dehydrogenase (short-subunit alcohol dehydrogenase family)
VGFRWSGKTVFITGASSGIGRALAVALGRRGASLGILARRADELEKTAGEIKAAGGRALACPADVCDLDAMRRAADSVREHLGPIDVMVANAGVGGTKPAADLEPEDVARVINTNVIGAVNTVTAVLPSMLARRSGHLVAISSLAAYRGLPRSGAYCASKAAVSAYFESLRLDLRTSGVTVTTIHPGFIKTPMTAGRRTRMPYLMELDEAVEKIIGAIEGRRTSYAFPWQLATIVRLLRPLPDALYDRILARSRIRE